MVEHNKYPIRDEWLKYYQKLEEIRQSGVCNMWGAVPYLHDYYPKLSETECQQILCSWIENYDALNRLFGWQKS